MTFYIVALILIGIACWLYRKYKKQILKFFWWLFDEQIMPEFRTDYSEYKKSSIANLVDTTTFSDKIFLRSFEPREDKDSKGFGIYYLSTGRKCVGIELLVPLLQSLEVKDLVVQIKTISSKNIDHYCESIKNVGNCKTKLSNNAILKKIQDDKIIKMHQWTNEKSASSTRWYVRDFRTFLILSFPEEVTEEKMKQCYIKLVSSIEGSFGIAPNELLKIYSELLRGESVNQSYDQHQMLNKQIAKGVEIGIEGSADNDEGLISIGKEYYAKVLTSTKYPIHTTISEVQNAFFPIRGTAQYPLPSLFQVSLTLHFQDQKKLRDKINQRATANVMAVEKTKAKKKDWDSFIATKPAVANKYNESKEIIQYIEDGEFLAEGFYSIVVYDKNQSNLNRNIEGIKKSFSSIKFGGWTISEESNALTALMCFISELPFNWEETTKKWLNRYNLLFTSNMIAILPIIGAFKGKGSPVLKFLTRPGQVVGYDFFACQTNYNCNIIGASGSGKSFLTNSIVLGYLQCNTQITIFDIGRSYKPLCDVVGGEFLVFSKEKEICLNFFTSLLTEKRTPSEGQEYLEFFNTNVPINEVLNEYGEYEQISSDSLASCVKIISLMVSDTPLSDLQNNVIAICLQYTFAKKGRNAGMEDFATSLKDLASDAKNNNRMDIVNVCDNLESALSEYAKPQGQYYDYFNGANNINLKNNLFIIETEELAGKPLYNVVFLAMLETVAQKFYFDRDARKMVVFDECAKILKHPLIAPYLDDFSRRLRKYNACMITATQKPDDYDINDSSRAIWSNAATNFLLPVKDVSQYFFDGKFFANYNDHQKTMLECAVGNAPHYSEITAIMERTTENIRLKVTPLEYTIFTTKADDINKRKEYKQKYGLTDNQAILFSALMMENELSESEVYKKVIEGDKEEQAKMWVKRISSALKDKKVYPYYQNIVDSNGEMMFPEIFTKIRFKTKEQDPETKEFFQREDTAGLPQFIDIAIERGVYHRIHSMMIRRAIKHFNEVGIGSFSLNVHNKEINGQYLRYYTDSHQHCLFDDFKGSILLEISAGFLKESNMNAITEFLSAINDNGKFGIVITDMDLNTNLEFLNIIKPVAIKIDGALVTSILNNTDEEEQQKLSLFKSIGKAYGCQVIAMHIENERALDAVKKIGFTYFQGNLLAPVKPLIKENSDV